MIRTFPRVYPDVAGVVGGVVGEASPQPITSLPEHVSSISPDSELPVAELAGAGAAQAAGDQRLGARRRHARRRERRASRLSLAAAGGSFIELRPFGATVVVSCAVPSNASTESVVSIPRALLAHLRAPDAAANGGNVGSRSRWRAGSARASRS